MSSSYEKVRGGKLSFKGGLGPEKTLDKKKHKKKKPKKVEEEGEEVAVEKGGEEMEKGGEEKEKEKEEEDKASDAIDTGTGHAPDGKKSKKYEELFPVETKRFGYVVPKVKSREAALDERIKKKADRYCK